MGHRPGCAPAPRRMVSEDGRSVGSGIQQVAGEALEQAGLARIDAEMVQLHLRLGPGQRGRALEGGGVAMLVDQVEHRLRAMLRPPSRRRCARSRRVRPARGGAGRRPDRARCRPCWTAGGRRSPRSAGRTSWPRPRNRARSVSTSGLPTASPSTIARCAAQISGSRRRAPPPRRQDGAQLGEILGRDEQLREGRMRDVVGLRRQHQFGIGGHVDLARPVAGIGDRDAADLGVVFGRDEHLQRGRQRAVAPGELGAILVEDDVIGVGFDAAGLEAGRPDLAAARRRAGRRRSPSRRRWRPRATASRRGLASGCSRSRRRSASRHSCRWTAGGWRAPRCARWSVAGRPAVPMPARWRPCFASAAQGRTTATSRGVPSCSSSSVAWTIGSAWKRVRITPSSNASAMATIVMP